MNMDAIKPGIVCEGKKFEQSIYPTSEGLGPSNAGMTHGYRRCPCFCGLIALLSSGNEIGYPQFLVRHGSCHGTTCCAVAPDALFDDFQGVWLDS